MLLDYGHEWWFKTYLKNMRIFSGNFNFWVNILLILRNSSYITKQNWHELWLNWIIVPLYVWCFFLFSLSVVKAINNHSVRCDRLDESESSTLCDGYHEYKTLIYDKVSLWPDMWLSPVFKADRSRRVEVWHLGTHWTYDEQRKTLPLWNEKSCIVGLVCDIFNLQDV